MNISNLTGIESNFCSSWEYWDQPSDFGIQFYGCHFKPEVVGQDVSQNCDLMFIDNEKSIVEFFHKNGEVFKTFKFKAMLTEEV